VVSCAGLAVASRSMSVVGGEAVMTTPGRYFAF
jgi:hypothetical protein